MRRSSAPLALLLAVVCGAATASAEVRLERRADGRLVITGSSPRPASPASRMDGLAPARRAEMSRLIALYSDRQRLDPRLVRALIEVESAFDPRAVSVRGALGLMQLMPATARELGVEDAFDPAQNLRGGTTYLRRLVDRFDGDLRLALASYNAGPEAVLRHGGVPPFAETTSYVERVLELFRRDGGDPGRAAAPPRRTVRLVSIPGQPLRLTTEDPGPETRGAR